MGGRQQRDIRRRKEGYYDEREDDQYGYRDNNRPPRLGDYAPRQNQNQGRQNQDDGIVYKIFKLNLEQRGFEYVCTLTGERPGKAYVHNTYGEGAYIVIDKDKNLIWFDYLCEENRQNQRRQG